jgi:hypothetical protein
VIVYFTFSHDLIHHDLIMYVITDLKCSSLHAHAPHDSTLDAGWLQETGSNKQQQQQRYNTEGSLDNRHDCSREAIRHWCDGDATEWRSSR